MLGHLATPTGGPGLVGERSIGVEESPRAGSAALSQLDAHVERVRVQVPPAPANILEGYVKYAPLVSIVVGIFAGVALVGLLGFVATVSGFITPFVGYYYGASLFQGIFFGLLLTVADII